ncbi:hypothetical protein VTJ49DRAFT_527 [Mycothermus thermophilus]|uniref:protein O-GlcNAc transferase n=1 Tax=Humicola insolens TaxID=85995 RepID=A0ABR3VES3_HUMIN
MLPAVQMHQMVPPPLDFLGPHHGHYSAYHHGHHPSQPSQAPHHGPSSTPRAFATRPTQHVPALHRITTSISRLRGHDQAESSLRRKTPSGTIDNGYDGSLTHLASGPPPLKHLIIPASSRIFPTAMVQRAAPSPAVAGLQQQQHHQQQPPAGPWPYAPLTPTAAAFNSGATQLPPDNRLAATPRGWGAGPLNPAADPRAADGASFLQQSVPRNNYHAGAFGHGYQPPLSPTVYSPGGIPQPAVWRDGSLGYQTFIPLVNGYTPQNAADGAFMAPHPTMHHALVNAPILGQNPYFGLQTPNHPPLDDGFSRYSHGQMAHHGVLPGRDSVPAVPSAAFPANALTPPDMTEPARFREWVLQRAHKAYSDLLVYLTNFKKAHHNHSSHHARTPSRMMVYPKPSASVSASGSKPEPAPTFFGQPTGYAQQAAQKEAAAALALSMHPSSDAVQNAKTWLDLLTTICEETGWRWVEGVILGGCLHYFMEHYEVALEWFKRIVNLDPSHVEAISNVAACLYCLNRHEEAERHWMTAIKLRPSYLEAVEHLVSLLCSTQRNAAAVNIIEFVQRSLGIARTDVPQDQASETASEVDVASPMTLTESIPDSYVFDTEGPDSPEKRFASASAADDSKAPGFGSSGYRIPGSENGRMILLIHAKGNMLYTLKNIDRASEAFEEVVMISTGKQVGGVKSLMRRIQSVLAPRNLQTDPPAPLLLPPDKAKLAAHFVFASTGGQLPGLLYVPEGSHKRSVVATTSNSLLSLAKIYQDAMSSGGPSSGLMRQPAGVGDILSLYYLSLSLQESPSTANNVGILLAGVQQTAPVQVLSQSDMSLAASVPGIVPGSGLALALAYYQYGLTLDPKHVHLHTNLGSLLKDIGQLDMAIQMYEQAVACDGTFDIALTNLANAVKDRGRIADAIKYYQRAVAANPDFAEAVCGLSTALNSVCDWRGRGGVLLAGGRYDRWHVDDKGMLQDVKNRGQGSGLMQRVVNIVGRQLKESSTWGCGVLQGQSLQQLVAELRETGAVDGSIDLEAELRKWAGRPGEGYRILRLIERSAIVAMRRWYREKHVLKLPQPSARYRRAKPPASLSVPLAPTVLPFHTFTCPLPAKEVRLISQRNALRISFSTLRSPWIPNIVYEPPDPPSPHLNVGYISSDFNNHPLAHLMQSVFGMHNPRRVKAFCYATTASDKSIHRQQIEREAPVFRDVTTWPPDKLVEQIVKDKIHILVNLNGYTRGARNEIFAARPAPIQMSFMGFAGTLGAEWCDYLLADSIAIPPSTLRPHRSNLALGDVFRDEADADAEDWIYSENIVFCRETFFCCDHAQSADGHDERGMTWEEDQRRRWKMRKELFPNLPDDAILMGNFNQLYKIDPTTFRSWLRILAAAPKAYLWLLRFPELGETHLRRTARDWGGEGVASRILFTDVAPKQQHISRARVCDLFLDTPECNAHTTAADILWSNTPLLTLPRYEYKMCSRMAASILRGALPRGAEGDQAARELVAKDEAEYEEFAVRLVNGLAYVPRAGGQYWEGIGRLAELRRLLFDAKWTCALFDTRRWVRDLEEAYEKAWDRWVRGEGGDIYL